MIQRSQIMPGSVMVPKMMAVLAVLLLASCSNQSPNLASTNGNKTDSAEIDRLAQSIQGQVPDQVRQTIINQLGPATRDVGSGLRIGQWDVAGGVLTFHPLTGPTFLNQDGRVVHLMRTTNPLEENLLGSYEMTTLPDPFNHDTRYWLGNLSLSKGNHFVYQDSGQNLSQRSDQADNFFIQHPQGRLRIDYPPGVTPDALLENLPDTSVVATITFSADDENSESRFSIVTRRDAMILEFASDSGIPFSLQKGWLNYWR